MFFDPLFKYDITLFNGDWTIYTLIAIVDIITLLHILKNKHEEPASALLWIFFIIVFPIIGLIFYSLIGINRIKIKAKKLEYASRNLKNVIKNQQGTFFGFLQKVREFNYSSDSEYMRILDRLIPDTYPTSGNKIELLENGDMAYPKMLQAIRDAKKHIHLQSYIIGNDEVGNMLFKTLEKKAQEGVKVKVLFDRFGSSKAYSSHFFRKWSKKKNLEVLPFSKFNLLAPYRIQLRNHRKVLICDGEVAFIGGINISSVNVKSLSPKSIHDLHCRVVGPSIGEIQLSFLRDWSFVTKKNPKVYLESGEYFPPPKNCGNAKIRISPSGPGHAYEASKKLFMASTQTAKNSILIETPYFVPDNSFIEALCMAAARGVDIKIIIPENNNHWYVKYATRSFYNTLLEYGIKIYEKKGNFSHTKAMLIDNIWGVMGSSNCDTRSFKLNYELNFIVEESEFIDTLYNHLQKELANSSKITFAERSKRTFIGEIIENFCSLLTPVL